MGHLEDCAFPCRNKPLVISLALLLLLLLTAQGRAVPYAASELLVRLQAISEEKTRLLGSRPPRCERRCTTCVHCQAIQVPIAPQQQRKQQQQNQQSSAATLNSRGDDLSNYKPMSWKCKCGSFIFNP
ncbi:hypothetical protein V2J09_007474 [Rumex salicifolius]